MPELPRSTAGARPLPPGDRDVARGGHLAARARGSGAGEPGGWSHDVGHPDRGNHGGYGGAAEGDRGSHDPHRGGGEDAADDHGDHGRGGVLGFLAELPALMLVAFVMAVLLKTFLVQAFWIPSESMVPTLEISDRVLVNKLAYRLGDPGRGDVVVFSDPAVEETGGLVDGLWSALTSGFGLTPPGEEDFIKRIIGLPGETIEITDGVVYADGQPLPEAPTGQGGYLGGPTDDFGPVTVPADEYFVMGDNRPFSADSRTLLGTVPRDHLVGRAFVLIWPLDRARLLSAPDYDRGAAAGPAGATPSIVADTAPSRPRVAAVTAAGGA